MLYINNLIVAESDESEIQNFIKEIKETKLDTTKEGDIKEFLGVNIKKVKR